MALATQAWYVDGLARSGEVDAAAKALTDISPAELFDLERDGYWLPTLGLLADAAHRADLAPVADAAGELLEPVLQLTIVDLSIAAGTHDRQGSPWMVRESTEALDALR